MNTIRIYREDVYRTECDAKVTSIAKDDKGYILEFDQSVFFPEGGGQSSDRGTVTFEAIPGAVFTIDDVQEDGERVLHHLALGGRYTELTPEVSDADKESKIKEVESALEKIGEGATVSMKIEWDIRFDNMQRHCGEHIVSGMLFREYGGQNKGFHMGEDYMTIDIELPADSEHKEITWEMAMHVERLANEVIWKNAPVRVDYFDTREEAAKMPLRKELAFDEDISIVTIGDVEDPYDCVACCGTHPSLTGQVGIIKIYKLEANKGMTRLYLDAGRRAYEDFEKKHKILTDIANHYTTGVDELQGKLAANDSALVEARVNLANMRRIVLEQRSEDIRKELEESEADKAKHLVVRHYSDLKVEDMLHIAKPFTGKTSKLIVLAADNHSTIILTSNGKTYDCGKLIKDNCGIYNGKGGGRPDNARCLFPDNESVDLFIDLLEKHLR